MYFILAFITLLGSFLIVNTSRRTVLRDLGKFNFIQKNKKISQFIGVICLLVPLVVLISQMNITTAIIMWINLIILMFMLVVILNPLQQVRYLHVFIVFLIFFLIEITLTYAC